MDQQLPACAICGTTQQLLRCAKCKTVYYCSSSHQYIDWPSHKKECRQLARQKTNSKQLQQLQQAVAAATLNNVTDSVDSAVHQQTTAYLGVGACGGSALASALTVKFGTNENEIMNTQAESMLPLHTNGVGTYLGNVEANTTTMDQMYSCNNEEQQLHPQWQQDLLSQQYGAQQSLEQKTPHHQQQQHPQQQYNLLLQHDQHPYLQQQLSNQNSKQFEKSSSYQIELGDENSSGNVNERRYEELCRNIINDMNQYGLSVVDDFLGMEKGLDILSEVHHMYAAGVFRDGQLVSNLIAEDEKRTIRGDKITWVKGVEPGCSNVGYLINQIDAVICRANTMKNNGKLGNYNIRERTKAMVACYPGSGSHYVMHVDNPNYDGRVITAIYYLNVNWDTLRSGGVLRIFPENGGSVADIEPKFDRLIFFWSDKRNPHEVQPAHRTRYAITVWYFDAEEREAALNRCRTIKNKASSATIKPANIPTTTNTADVFT